MGKNCWEFKNCGRITGAASYAGHLIVCWIVDGIDSAHDKVLRQISRKDSAGELLQYQSSEGHERYREAGVTWFKGMGVTADPALVIPTNGAQHAMMLVLGTIAKAGDLVLTEELTYPGIKAIADMQNIRLVGVPLDKEGILPEEMEKLVSNRKVRALYTIPSLQNPTIGKGSQSSIPCWRSIHSGRE